VSNFASLYENLESTVRSDGKLGVGLRWRLAGAYEAIITRPYEPSRIAAALEELLAYLASKEGRTHPNCVAVDHFFCMGDGWERDWEDEPSELTDVLADIGGALHDTIKAPEIAENFDSTPEQLLDRIRAFRAKHGAA
jgi:hypothetical protein